MDTKIATKTNIKHHEAHFHMSNITSTSINYALNYPRSFLYSDLSINMV